MRVPTLRGVSSSSSESLEQLEMSSTTAFSWSSFTKFRHSYVKWPEGKGD